MRSAILEPSDVHTESHKPNRSTPIRLLRSSVVRCSTDSQQLPQVSQLRMEPAHLNTAAFLTGSPGLLVDCVPLIWLANVRTAVTDDPPHRIHRIVEAATGVAVVAPSLRSPGRTVHRVKDIDGAAFCFLAIDIDGIAVGCRRLLSAHIQGTVLCGFMSMALRFRYATPSPTAVLLPSC